MLSLNPILVPSLSFSCWIVTPHAPALITTSFVFDAHSLLFAIPSYLPHAFLTSAVVQHFCSAFTVQAPVHSFSSMVGVLNALLPDASRWQRPNQEAEGDGCSTSGWALLEEPLYPAKHSLSSSTTPNPIPGVPALGTLHHPKCNFSPWLPLRTPSVNTNPFQGLVLSPGCVWRPQAELWRNLQLCENHLSAFTAASAGIV